ncbi:hypothetical protein BJ170DRAFT_593435 [Xylariales sp. AK1849]|nr:hypothetical protein BJ170DRAFT_593435 [Xylariales sp. AK1849]
MESSSLFMLIVLLASFVAASTAPTCATLTITTPTTVTTTVTIALASSLQPVYSTIMLTSVRHTTTSRKTSTTTSTIICDGFFGDCISVPIITCSTNDYPTYTSGWPSYTSDCEESTSTSLMHYSTFTDYPTYTFHTYPTTTTISVSSSSHSTQTSIITTSTTPESSLSNSPHCLSSGSTLSSVASIDGYRPTSTGVVPVTAGTVVIKPTSRAQVILGALAFIVIGMFGVV